MLAVCSLCCRLTVYNFQHIRLRSLDRLGMTDNCFRTRRKVSECPPPQEFSLRRRGVLCRLYFEYKKKTSCNFVSAVLYCPCRVRQGRFFLPPCGFLRGRGRGKSRFLLKGWQSAPRGGGAFCAACPFVYEKCLAFFRAGVLY